MNTAEILVKILEEEGVNCIFGHPGEQILPFYKALSSSNIKHILTRHEQGAVHACDGYARSSGKYGVCLATAGPGAMNLIMGVATAFKDSVPILVITGDNDSTTNKENFQSFPINDVFENIVVKSFNPVSADLAICDLKEALMILKTYPKGPVHINLPKDVLLDEPKLTEQELDSLIIDYLPNKLFDNTHHNVDLAIQKINNAEKPLIIVGNGVVWGQAIDLLKDFVSKYKVPITTTYHSKGIISEYDDLNLGLVGLRGEAISDYAYLNSDCIIVLGARLSERTIAKSPKDEKGHISKEFMEKIIHVNIDRECLKGNINICANVFNFLETLLKEISLDNYNSKKWIEEIYSHKEDIVIDGIDDDSLDLRPPFVINKIMEAFKGSYFLSDAGTHTTWTTLLAKSDNFGKLLFSGGFGPMGYGLPASIGVAIACNDDKVVVICGDGDIQMVSQELATLAEYDLNVAIFVINNSQLGIIRQWEETIYDFDENYQVDLNNPDFVKLADAYHLKSFRAVDSESLDLAINEALKKGPCLVDVRVRQEDIPMPK